MGSNESNSNVRYFMKLHQNHLLGEILIKLRCIGLGVRDVLVGVGSTKFGNLGMKEKRGSCSSLMMEVINPLRTKKPKLGLTFEQF